MAVAFCRRRILSYRYNLLLTPCRTGYIVLIPETTRELPHYDKLAKVDGLPDFNDLTTSNCEMLLIGLAQKVEAGIWELDQTIGKAQLDKNKKIDVIKNIIEPLEILGVEMENTWGNLKALCFARQDLMHFEKFRKLHEKAMNSRSLRFFTPSIFTAFKEASTNDFESFTEEEKRVVKKYVLEGQLNCLGLDVKDYERALFSKNAAKKKKEAIRSKFQNSITKFQAIITDQQIVKNFPEELLKKIAEDPENPRSGPWIANLFPNVYYDFLQYCPDRDLRMSVWSSKVKMCSHDYDRDNSTSVDIDELRQHQELLAKQLNFETNAHMSMTTKMAGSLEKVQNMLDTLLEAAKPVQEAEINQLEEFAFERNFCHSLELWDLPYWKRIQLKTLYHFDDFEVMDYFPLGQVTLGLFALCEQLFGIKIEEDISVKAWDDSVRFYRIFDEKSSKYLGGFYFDPYFRRNKCNNYVDRGWMIGMRNKSQVCKTLPLAALIFNFTPPTADKPCLLPFRDVQLLFKKFGHLLQHVLTETNFSDLSGLSNLEWDAIDICSEFMGLWVYEKGTLESISDHYETGDSLPSEILDNLNNIQKHLAGYSTCREIYLSNLDLQLQLTHEYWKNVMRRLWPKHFIFELDNVDAHPCSFRESLVDEWTAAYYSHLWSRVLAADIFAAFTEVGFKNIQDLNALGRKFRSTFLASGGALHASEVFRRFRGRDPSYIPFIKLMGLDNRNKNMAPTPEEAPAAV